MSAPGRLLTWWLCMWLRMGRGSNRYAWGCMCVYVWCVCVCTHIYIYIPISNLHTPIYIRYTYYTHIYIIYTYIHIYIIYTYIHPLYYIHPIYTHIYPIYTHTIHTHIYIHYILGIVEQRGRQCGIQLLETLQIQT